jgi:tripartite-type tricarboxylate transporter receptor subunit TctC
MRIARHRIARAEICRVRKEGARMRRLGILLLTMCVTLASGAALAQAYPSKPIRLIVPFPAGGAVDISARAIGAELSRSLGQQVVVENRPGAGGNLAAEAAARAAPDGYTLFMATSAILAVNPVLYAKVPFDPIKDFAPISVVASSDNVLVVHPSVPAQTVGELIALAKANPGKYSYASSGSGSSTHLAAEMFKMMAGVDLLHVPYKGGPPGVVDLLAGQVNMIFDLVPSALPHIRSGKIRALGVAGVQRSPLLPGVPLISESGVPGYRSSVWFGLVAPAGTPAEIVSRLSADVAKGVRQAEFRDRLTGMGYDVTSTTPEQMAELIRADIPRWAQVVKTNGIKID